MRLTNRELMEWAAFERIEGPMLVHERVDFAAALISWIVVRASGTRREYRLDQFLPKWDRAGEEKPRQKPEDMMGFMRGLQRRKGRRKRAPD